ncbi:hypothetical protein L6452_06547 [Arctium lappa]|uniref:Uncharacterized protein n=1 Tax=Arctium lappa TaxID=4217 RepID=A0ACB9EJ74_ARCLA|nr:hypothetical protein L6452_06547 [Arctium lappa]
MSSFLSLFSLDLQITRLSSFSPFLQSRFLIKTIVGFFLCSITISGKHPPWPPSRQPLLTSHAPVPLIPGSGQAVAIRVIADRCAFYNCRLLGILSIKSYTQQQGKMMLSKTDT